MMANRRNPHQVDVYVGAKVRQLRIAKQMSLEHLGEAIGVTYQQAQKYEKGQNRISASRLVQIAEVFEREVGWFFQDAPSGKVSIGTPVLDSWDQLVATREGLALASAFVAIKDAKMRAVFVALLQDVAELTSSPP